jgi:hypothetical protein
MTRDERVRAEAANLKIWVRIVALRRLAQERLPRLKLPMRF